MTATAFTVALLIAGPLLTFEWTPPQDEPTPSHYELELSQEGMPPQYTTTTEPRGDLNVALVRPFRVRVRACWDGVCGDWSERTTRMSLNLSADYDGDGRVGLGDYTRLGAPNVPPSEKDLTGDGHLGLPDLREFFRHWGACTGQTLVDGVVAPAYVECDPT